MIKGQETLRYEERLKPLGLFQPLPFYDSMVLFSLEKRRLKGDLIPVSQYLKGSYKEERGSLFASSHVEKTRDSGYKLHWEKIYLDTGKKFFTVRTIIHWNNLPRDVV